MEASDSLPEFREWIFSFHSRSRISGMDSSHSRIDPFKVGNQKGKLEILRDASIPTFSASCTFIQDKNGGSKVKVAYVKVSNQATS